MRDNCLTITETKRFGGDVERSVGEHATDSNQPCRKGALRGSITALEAANEEYRLIHRLPNTLAFIA